MSSEKSLELVYFQFKGRANPIRLVLIDQGISYTETLISLQDWPAAKAKYPFAQLPVLIVNGQTQLAQSQTIARYLAKEHGLLGSNPLEEAQVEMLIDQMLDVRAKFNAMIQTNYEAGAKPFLESLPSLLAPFESRLASSPDSAGFLALGRLTLAEYALFDLLFFLLALKNEEVKSSSRLDGTPALKAFYASFGERPKIRDYLLSETFKNLRTSISQHLN